MTMWKAKLKDGKEVSELTSRWEDIKNDIIDLLMITNSNQVVQLPKKMEKYIQFKTASAEIGKNNIQIESRVIGGKFGNNIVKVRIDEKTNNINIEIE